MNTIMQMLLPVMHLNSGTQSSSFPSEANEVFARLVDEEVGKFLGRDWQKNADLAALLNSPLFAQLLTHLNGLLDKVGATDIQKQELLDQIIAKITESFANGDTEGLISFFSTILNAETPQDIQQALDKFATSKNETVQYIDQKGNAFVPQNAETDQSQVLSELTVETTNKDVMATANEQFVADVPKILDTVNGEHVLNRLVGMFEEKEDALTGFVKSGEVKIDPVLKLDSAQMEFVSLMKDIEFNVDKESVLGSNAATTAADIQARIDMMSSIKELVERMELKTAPKVIQTVFELKPPNMGHTQLRLELSDQKVMLDFLVARAEAKEMIQNSLSDLRTMFQDKGLVIGEVNVDVDPNLSLGHGLFSRDLAQQNSHHQGALSGNVAGPVLFDEDSVRTYDTLYLDAARVNCLA
ncbi:MAG: flagellar hook-length control protein FliK [Candidatus Omnitrophica bacterium]|nr:flagellar hook-length control protein FliK [Candidatus Omnitrophota bacterium]